MLPPTCASLPYLNAWTRVMSWCRRGSACLPSFGARVGTSSLRRRAQLSHRRPDLCLLDLRGNLDTRLRKVESGEYDAIVLAYAGLARMGWLECITEKLPPEVCLGAVGQGALALQAREGDEETLGLLRALNHPESETAVRAERAMMHALHGGCQAPVGAYARVSEGWLVLTGLVASLDGRRLVRLEVTGDPCEPEELGTTLAAAMLDSGAEEILDEISREVPDS